MPRLHEPANEGVLTGEQGGRQREGQRAGAVGLAEQILSKFAGQFHNRMPLVLEPDTWDLWMKGDSDTAAALMKAADEDALVSRPVNKAVGNVKNNRPELLATAS